MLIESWYTETLKELLSHMGVVTRELGSIEHFTAEGDFCQAVYTFTLHEPFFSETYLASDGNDYKIDKLVYYKNINIEEDKLEFITKSGEHHLVNREGTNLPDSTLIQLIGQFCCYASVKLDIMQEEASNLTDGQKKLIRIASAVLTAAVKLSLIVK